eukprot:1785848-Pyramimonas_sp.AAC.1
MLVSHRCSKAGPSIANHHYDVVNACAPPSHDTMDHATQHLMRSIKTTTTYLTNKTLHFSTSPNKMNAYYVSITVALLVSYKLPTFLLSFAPAAVPFKALALPLTGFCVPDWRAARDWSSATKGSSPACSIAAQRVRRRLLCHFLG